MDCWVHYLFTAIVVLRFIASSRKSVKKFLENFEKFKNFFSTFKFAPFFSYNNTKWQKILEAMAVAIASAIIPFLAMIFFVECKSYHQELDTDYPIQARILKSNRSYLTKFCPNLDSGLPTKFGIKF